jgi:hypothetical protein
MIAIICEKHWHSKPGTLELRIRTRIRPIKIFSFIKACKYRYYEIAIYLISRGADVTIRNNVGQNALHYSCQSGDLKTFNLLVQTNKDLLTVADRFLLKPLFTASLYGNCSHVLAFSIAYHKCVYVLSAVVHQAIQLLSTNMTMTVFAVEWN